MKRENIQNKSKKEKGKIPDNQDLTALTRELEAAREHTQRLQMFLDNMPARLAYIDIQEKYVFVNEAHEQFFGLKMKDIVGQPVKTIVGPENYANVKKYLEQAASGEKVQYETPFKTRAGEEKWLDISYVPDYDSNGKLRGFYGLSLDRTEKKRIEQEKQALEIRLHQAEKMEAIGTLAGGIAHDFNNILSGIFGYSQLAQTHLTKPDKAKLYITKIFENAQRASLLIQQILAFSRHSDYDRRPLNVFLQLKEALKMLRSIIPANIEIKENLSSNAKILADATQIHQVIMNLCTNASHAMGDESGTLTVLLDEIEFDPKTIFPGANHPPGTYLRLEISDTGPGIDPKIRKRIFEPYFTTKEISKGTGLGLAVVDGIVKKHSGFIHVDSRPGYGARFLVYLPVICADNCAKAPEPDNVLFFPGNESILIVDDEPDIRESLTSIFKGQGYQVTACENGAEALSLFTKDPSRFDILVTDMTMPVMTGDKLSREVLKIRDNIPIVLCTGYHETFTRQAALDIGIKEYIEKPVSGMELSEIVRSRLDRAAFK